MSVTPAQFDAAGNMQELYDLLTSCGIENGWNKPEPSLWPQPRKDFLPAHWSYAIGKSALNAARASRILMYALTRVLVGGSSSCSSMLCS